MTAIDWTRWRKCPVCFAETGSACTTRTGVVVNGRVVSATITAAEKPHSTRKSRTTTPGKDRPVS
jgi:hypothetical protein